LGISIDSAWKWKTGAYVTAKRAGRFLDALWTPRCPLPAPLVYSPGVREKAPGKNQGASMTFFVEGVSKHLEPKTQVRRIGEYQTIAEAITVARGTIDEFLAKAVLPGMDAKALFTLYQSHGEYPFIFRDDDKTFNVPGFNHAHYAMTRAAEVCGGKK
jgi:hypothetical protein